MLNPTSRSTNQKTAARSFHLSFISARAAGGAELCAGLLFTFHGFRYLKITGLTKQQSLRGYRHCPRVGQNARNRRVLLFDPRLITSSNIQWARRQLSSVFPTDLPHLDDAWMDG